MPDALRLVGLSTKLHNYPDQLSGGEQQRVSIARAFVNHPPLLLADEPSGNLDPVTSIGIMQLLYRINKTGTTVVVVTHDREMVDNMRRRVIELYEGRVVRDEAAAATPRSRHRVRAAVRAEMGVGHEGDHGHDHGSPDVPTPLLHPGGLPRAAPQRRAEHGGDRHHGVTVILLGVLIPVFQTDQARATRSATSSTSASSSTTTPQARRTRSSRCRRSSRRSRTSSRSTFVSKDQALSNSASASSRTTGRTHRAAARRHNPLPANFNVTPDDLANLRSMRSAITPPGRERPADADQPADLRTSATRAKTPEDRAVSPGVR